MYSLISRQDFHKSNIAIIPLWKEKDKLGVLITTPDRSEAAIKAGRAIQALMDQSSETSDNGQKTLILDAIAAFKSKDFEKSYAIAARGR